MFLFQIFIIKLNNVLWPKWKFYNRTPSFLNYWGSQSHFWDKWRTLFLSWYKIIKTINYLLTFFVTETTQMKLITYCTLAFDKDKELIMRKEGCAWLQCASWGWSVGWCDEDSVDTGTVALCHTRSADAPSDPSCTCSSDHNRDTQTSLPLSHQILSL